MWSFYTLSNGGAFMAPETNGDTDEKLALFNTLNGNGAEITSEAAGIVACLMAYSHHACRTFHCNVTLLYGERWQIQGGDTMSKANNAATTKRKRKSN
ncbi:hypothetical protein EWI30_18845 [Enterobacter cloacae]|nr:hypothetical protein EWI30_18845 [Enterobacter cloacae]